MSGVGHTDHEGESLSPAPASWPAGKDRAELEISPGRRLEVQAAEGGDRLELAFSLHATGGAVKLEERQVRALVILLMAGWGRLRRGG